MADERIATFASVTGRDAGFAARALRVRATRATNARARGRSRDDGWRARFVAMRRARSRARTRT